MCHFRNVRTDVLLCVAIDFDHFEGRADTAGTQPREDPVVTVSESNDLVFRPKSSCRRRWWRYGLAEKLRQTELQLLKGRPIGLLGRHSTVEDGASSLADGVRHALDCSPQRGANRIY